MKLIQCKFAKLIAGTLGALMLVAVSTSFAGPDPAGDPKVYGRDNTQKMRSDRDLSGGAHDFRGSESSKAEWYDHRRGPRPGPGHRPPGYYPPGHSYPPYYWRHHHGYPHWWGSRHRDLFCRYHPYNWRCRMHIQ